ncbi:hypothetical protein [Amycolatopsis nigrescens]|nr:hypothetical protein [Amycolatopsis nigrescens]
MPAHEGPATVPLLGHTVELPGAPDSPEANELADLVTAELTKDDD